MGEFDETSLGVLNCLRLNNVKEVIVWGQMHCYRITRKSDLLCHEEEEIQLTRQGITERFSMAIAKSLNDPERERELESEFGFCLIGGFTHIKHQMTAI